MNQVTIASDNDLAPVGAKPIPGLVIHHSRDTIGMFTNGMVLNYFEET